MHPCADKNCGNDLFSKIFIGMSYPKDEKSFTVDPQHISKIPTRIEGLDEVMYGGIPEGRLTIVKGDTGAGKTVLSMELIVRGTEAGRPAAFVSFEESKGSIRRNTLSMGWDLAQIEKEELLTLISPEIDYEAVTAGEYSIDGLCGILDGIIEKRGIVLLIIDAFDMLIRLFDDPKEAQNQMVKLHRWLSKRNVTVIMTVKDVEKYEERYGYLNFMADCIISLDQRVEYQVTTRRLRVQKYRGSDFGSREHPFIISDKGIVVMPLFVVNLVEKPTGEFVSTNIEQLDKILGGGYRRGSSILINGPSGSGKTTLAFTIITGAAKKGEKVLYISLEESEPTLISEMTSVGYDTQSLIDSGNLKITATPPEAMGMEEHLYGILQNIEEYKPDHLVLDAISATHRIGSEQASRELLIRLYHATKQRGITCIYTNQTLTPLDEEVQLAGLGISSLVDTAIFVNYATEEDRISRKLLILKSRGTNHSTRYHHFRITDKGLKIEGPDYAG